MRVHKVLIILFVLFFAAVAFADYDYSDCVSDSSETFDIPIEKIVIKGGDNFVFGIDNKTYREYIGKGPEYTTIPPTNEKVWMFEESVKTGFWVGQSEKMYLNSGQGYFINKYVNVKEGYAAEFLKAVAGFKGKKGYICGLDKLKEMAEKNPNFNANIFYRLNFRSRAGGSQVFSLSYEKVNEKIVHVVKDVTVNPGMPSFGMYQDNGVRSAADTTLYRLTGGSDIDSFDLDNGVGFVDVVFRTKRNKDFRMMFNGYMWLIDGKPISQYSKDNETAPFVSTIKAKGATKIGKSGYFSGLDAIVSALSGYREEEIDATFVRKGAESKENRLQGVEEVVLYNYGDNENMSNYDVDSDEFDIDGKINPRYGWLYEITRDAAFEYVGEDDYPILKITYYPGNLGKLAGAGAAIGGLLIPIPGLGKLKWAGKLLKVGVKGGSLAGGLGLMSGGEIGYVFDKSQRGWMIQAGASSFITQNFGSIEPEEFELINGYDTGAMELINEQKKNLGGLLNRMTVVQMPLSKEDKDRYGREVLEHNKKYADGDVDYRLAPLSELNVPRKIEINAGTIESMQYSYYPPLKRVVMTKSPAVVPYYNSSKLYPIYELSIECRNTIEGFFLRDTRLMYHTGFSNNLVVGQDGRWLVTHANIFEDWSDVREVSQNGGVPDALKTMALQLDQRGYDGGVELIWNKLKNDRSCVLNVSQRNNLNEIDPSKAYKIQSSEADRIYFLERGAKGYHISQSAAKGGIVFSLVGLNDPSKQILDYDGVLKPITTVVKKVGVEFIPKGSSGEILVSSPAVYNFSTTENIGQVMRVVGDAEYVVKVAFYREDGSVILPFYYDTYDLESIGLGSVKTEVINELPVNDLGKFVSEGGRVYEIPIEIYEPLLEMPSYLPVELDRENLIAKGYSFEDLSKVCMGLTDASGSFVSITQNCLNNSSGTSNLLRDVAGKIYLREVDNGGSSASWVLLLNGINATNKNAMIYYLKAYLPDVDPIPEVQISVAPEGKKVSNEVIFGSFSGWDTFSYPSSGLRKLSEFSFPEKAKITDLTKSGISISPIGLDRSLYWEFDVALRELGVASGYPPKEVNLITSSNNLKLKIDEISLIDGLGFKRNFRFSVNLGGVYLECTNSNKLGNFLIWEDSDPVECKLPGDLTNTSVLRFDIVSENSLSSPAVVKVTSKYIPEACDNRYLYYSRMPKNGSFDTIDCSDIRFGEVGRTTVDSFDKSAINTVLNNVNQQENTINLLTKDGSEDIMVTLENGSMPLTIITGYDKSLVDNVFNKSGVPKISFKLKGKNDYVLEKFGSTNNGFYNYYVSGLNDPVLQVKFERTVGGTRVIINSKFVPDVCHSKQLNANLVPFSFNTNTCSESGFDSEQDRIIVRLEGGGAVKFFEGFKDNFDKLYLMDVGGIVAKANGLHTDTITNDQNENRIDVIATFEKGLSNLTVDEEACVYMYLEGEEQSEGWPWVLAGARGKQASPLECPKAPIKKN
jgi:hypothetical protein